jgi:hypothetical protein
VTIQIEEGKFYWNSEGRRVGPLETRLFDLEFPWTVDDGQELYRADGTRYGDKAPLVAEWVGPVEEPCPAQIAVEGTPLPFPSPEDVERILGNAPPDIKTEIADTAKSIVAGARRGAYGKPEDNFERIARYWDAYFKNTGRNVDITAADVSPLMRLVKEARLNETPDHKDSFVDLVGYTLTGAEVNGVKPA